MSDEDITFDEAHALVDGITQMDRKVCELRFDIANTRARLERWLVRLDDDQRLLFREENPWFPATDLVFGSDGSLVGRIRFVAFGP